MEPASLDVSLKFLAEAEIHPTHLVTDRSTIVRTLIKNNWPGIKQQFDVWHWIKVCILVPQS